MTTTLFGIDLLNKTPRHSVFIVSGEGEGNYTRSLFSGKRTQRAIKARLTRERCKGTRWARAEITLNYDNQIGPVFMDMKTGEYMN